MYTVDALKHMLLALYHHEPDDFECELREIVRSIAADLPYDNCPGLEKEDLVELVNKTLDCVEYGYIRERTLRTAIRKIIASEQE